MRKVANLDNNASEKHKKLLITFIDQVNYSFMLYF